MMKVDYRLNAIVDAAITGEGDLAGLAAIAAANGATVIQYRDKHASSRRMVEHASAIVAAIAGTGVPLLVNDRVDVALAAGAHGVHLGRDDMAAATARRLLGPDAIIGLTVKNAEDADAAASAPCDYACIGGVFATASKDNPDPPVGLEGFSVLRRQLAARRPDLPVGAIAGIDLARAEAVVRHGASGVAVISAIFRSGDVGEATRAFRAAVDRALAEAAR
jgi:thiamine-phosphate pyrophosphorylase